jgi:hypothetical protein
MKIRNLKTKVIGPGLLLIPMACMHLGDDHHSGGHHSSTIPPSSCQYSLDELPFQEIVGRELTGKLT